MTNIQKAIVLHLICRVIKQQGFDDFLIKEKATELEGLLYNYLTIKCKDNVQQHQETAVQRFSQLWT